MSHTTLRRLTIVVIILAAVGIVLAMFHLFRPYDKSVISGLTIVAGALALVVSVSRLRRRAMRNHEAKKTRDSLQKHLWEERYKREW